MNKARRARLKAILDTLETLQDELTEVIEEEEECKDNIPENLQGSERYEKAKEICDNLSYADDSLTELIDYIAEAIE